MDELRGREGGERRKGNEEERLEQGLARGRKTGE